MTQHGYKVINWRKILGFASIKSKWPCHHP